LGSLVALVAAPLAAAATPWAERAQLLRAMAALQPGVAAAAAAAATGAAAAAAAAAAGSGAAAASGVPGGVWLPTRAAADAVAALTAAAAHEAHPATKAYALASLGGW
jgi:hypothetical protein